MVALGSQSLFPHFQREVEKAIDQLGDKIEHGLDKLVDKFNSWKVRIAMAASPGLRALCKWRIEKYVDDVWEAFKKVVKKIWHEVSRMHGSPFELMTMNKKYLEAAGEMRGLRTDIDRATRQLRKGWFGEAFLAYEGLAKEQKEAAEGADATLTKAAQGCADGAEKIGHAWLDAVNVILKYIREVVDAVDSATDVAKWPTLGAGAATKVLWATASAFAEIATAMGRYLVTNATTEVGKWRDINTGALGFQNNDWPTPPAVDLDDVRTKGDWTHVA